MTQDTKLPLGVDGPEVEKYIFDSEKELRHVQNVLEITEYILSLDRTPECAIEAERLLNRLKQERQ